MSVVQQYYDKLSVCSQKYPSILDEFKRYYVIYNKHHEYQEYANIFSSTKGQLAELNKEVFVVTNDVQKNTDVLTKNSENLVMQLEQLKEENENLKKTLASSSGTNKSADEMNEDAKEEYKFQFLRNLSMFLGDIIVIGVLVKFFKK
jgi:rubrerythrin